MFRRVAGMLMPTVAALALFACSGSKDLVPVPTVPLPVPLPGPLPVVQQLADKIVEGAFEVPARTFKPFEVVVAAEMSHPRLEGTFTASGAANDIEVLLLTEQQFSNWQNRHEFKPAYVSGRVTADKLRVDLPSEPGKYYVIFNNRFSLMSKKGVVADLKLRYNRQG